MNIAITGDKKIAFKIKNLLENEKIDNIKIDIITSEDFIRLDVNLLQKYAFLKLIEMFPIDSNKNKMISVDL